MFSSSDSWIIPLFLSPFYFLHSFFSSSSLLALLAVIFSHFSWLFLRTPIKSSSSSCFSFLYLFLFILLSFRIFPFPYSCSFFYFCSSFFFLFSLFRLHLSPVLSSLFLSFIPHCLSPFPLLPSLFSPSLPFPSARQSLLQHKRAEHLSHSA